MAGVPQFGKSKMARSGSVRIRHREYITDIVSSASAGAFQSSEQLYINPGQAATFPWLATIAAQFEEYIIHGCVFQYVSTCADVSNGSAIALGTVMMCTQYNATAAPFINKQQMEQYQFGTSCKVSKSDRHIIEVSRGQTPAEELYVRTGALPSGQDQRLYDMGAFQIATQGLQGTSQNCGELWVTYDITLLKPKLSATGPQGIINSDHFILPYVFCLFCFAVIRV